MNSYQEQAYHERELSRYQATHGIQSVSLSEQISCGKAVEREDRCDSCHCTGPTTKEADGIRLCAKCRAVEPTEPPPGLTPHSDQ